MVPQALCEHLSVSIRSACIRATDRSRRLAAPTESRKTWAVHIHDLGEAISGDIPAVNKDSFPNKSEQERSDLILLTNTLDESLKAEILALWDDYENALSPEAVAVKALDKLETMLQHNQGKNPPDFDYEFNLAYGKKYTDAAPLFEALRNIIDEETKANMLLNPK